MKSLKSVLIAIAFSITGGANANTLPKEMEMLSSVDVSFVCFVRMHESVKSIMSANGSTELFAQALRIRQLWFDRAFKLGGTAEGLNRVHRIAQASVHQEALAQMGYCLDTGFSIYEIMPAGEKAELKANAVRTLRQIYAASGLQAR